MNTDNPVVKLCAAGMQAEAAGRLDEAATLFRQAWDARTDAFDACVAAHYVARHQDSPKATLEWNVVALSHAQEVQHDRVRSFYPSLYLNVAHAHEVLGDREAALRFYRLAEEVLSAVGADAYGELVRRGVSEGLRRIADAPPA